MSSISAIVKPTIFREYIGVKEYPDNLYDFPAYIINPKIPEFHFILGFATEDCDQTGRGTGHFKPTWNVCYFSAEKVKKLKANYPNVKVVISIGGRGAEHPFNPAEKCTWSDNAIESLKEIISYYKEIDGIDINYEQAKSSEENFSDCIGKVIKELKNNINVPVNVVSIAPSLLILSHYKRLYREYLDLIDWVDYKFYNQTVSSKDEFVKLFRNIANDYDIEKLLAGVSTDPDDACKMSDEVFIEGCTDLVNSALLRGVFVWNANDSTVPMSSDKPFFLEEKMQKILTKAD